jgi:hypothetical protein
MGRLMKIYDEDECIQWLMFEIQVTAIFKRSG